MKKLPILLLAAILLIISTTPVFAYQPPVKVYVDNNQVTFPDQQPYIDSASRTLVPVRAPMEMMGATVGWNDKTRQATVSKDGTTAVFTIGSYNYTVNGVQKSMDTRAVITGNRTVFPIRFVAEALGATVSWDGKTYTVYVSTTGTNSGPNTPTNPNTGLRTIHDPELGVMYKWFEEQGYVVELSPYTGIVNDYGCIEVNINKNASNKQQFDKDVYNKSVEWIGQDAGTWVLGNLDVCERDDAKVWNKMKKFGSKALAVLMKDNGDILVEFDSDIGY